MWKLTSVWSQRAPPDAPPRTREFRYMHRRPPTVRIPPSLAAMLEGAAPGSVPAPRMSASPAPPAATTGLHASGAAPAPGLVPLPRAPAPGGIPWALGPAPPAMPSPLPTVPAPRLGHDPMPVPPPAAREGRPAPAPAGFDPPTAPAPGWIPVGPATPVPVPAPDPGLPPPSPTPPAPAPGPAPPWASSAAPAQALLAFLPVADAPEPAPTFEPVPSVDDAVAFQEVGERDGFVLVEAPAPAADAVSGQFNPVAVEPAVPHLAKAGASRPGPT